ncbi:MAG: MaoC family dehydratase N-terminal domain-containing protein [Actinomycetota bacterium]|jgi:acyl dehydratase|nr:MaoC family dehydratase N-terminal domain-containing protein [Actinomycetota bacterium]
MAVDHFPVEASHILMFARAIGDTNPIYHDESHAAGTEVGSIIAPPTFAQASAQFDPDYFLRPKAGQKWFGSGGTASGIIGGEKKEASNSEGEEKESGSAAGGLHAEQHFTYHRHLKPGDVLTAETKPGESWEKESKRAGVLKFSESITEYRDQDGELVVTARGVGVVTEKVIEQ